MSETWVVATDFEACAEAAVEQAAEEAGHLDAGLVLVHVLPPPQMPTHVDTFGNPVGPTSPALSSETLREAALKRLGERAEALRAGRPDLRVEVSVREGDVVDAVLEAAEESGAHRLVVGTHGKRGLKRLVLGSVAENIIRRAHRPVLVVKAT